MRPTLRGGSYICQPCLLRHGGLTATKAIANQIASHSKSAGLQRSHLSTQSSYLSIGASSAASSINDWPSSGHASIRRVRSRLTRRVARSATTEAIKKTSADHASPDGPSIELSRQQIQNVQALYTLRRRLQQGINKVPDFSGDLSMVDGLPIETVLKVLPSGVDPEEEQIAQTIQRVYAGRPYSEVKEDLSKAIIHRNFAQRIIKDSKTKKALETLGIVIPADETSFDGVEDTVSSPAGKKTGSHSSTPSVQVKDSSKSQIPPQRSSLQAIATATSLKQTASVGGAKGESRAASTSPTVQKTSTQLSPTTRTTVKAVSSSDLKLEPISEGKQTDVPRLSFDLSRVLFNPGVYQLRDPRSRVYNFDPYLEQPMPISEFNFDALNEYVTSSEDKTLQRLASKHRKRYVGSSSSMSSALCQFHFLLSQWRQLNIGNLTKRFEEDRRDFTVISRAPAAVFLRYRDGVYAVDADKEFDEPNVLMSYGKSLEKLLTLEKTDFEKWRRQNTDADQEFADSQGEAFHYSSQGSFLLRSQLDAYDPRLPGSGIFDLKTRAVAGIRMDVRAHERGMGYQIKERFGTWESYEREYYDMMRSTFLKYSMQVRMGNMDGIFVAYHNIENIFGFQYVPLTEMDFALHGQTDPCLGDQEFRFSINFMNEIFDQATKEYPEQSIRFHFETREGSASEPKIHMHIFAEPVTEEEVTQIHKRANEEMMAFERRVLRGDNQEATVADSEELSSPSASPEDTVKSTPKDSQQDEAITPGSLVSNAANTAFLDEIINSVPADAKVAGPKPLMAFKLTIQNCINDVPRGRPEGISPRTKWSVDYTLEQLGTESSRRLYTFCKNRRMAALSVGRKSKSQFLQNIHDMSQRGAAWRREQDKLDSQRETVVLYTDKLTG